METFSKTFAQISLVAQKTDLSPFFFKGGGVGAAALPAPPGLYAYDNIELRFVGFILKFWVSNFLLFPHIIIIFTVPCAPCLNSCRSSWCQKLWEPLFLSQYHFLFVKYFYCISKKGATVPGWERETSFQPGFCEWLSTNKYGAEGPIPLGESSGMPHPWMFWKINRCVFQPINVSIGLEG